MKTEQPNNLPAFSLVRSVIAWNSARYPQEYSNQLAVDLMAEEAPEGFIATDHVEMLDSVGDQIFVAVGIFWKAGFLDCDTAIGEIDLAIQNHDFERVYEFITEIHAERFFDEILPLGLVLAIAAFVNCVRALDYLNTAGRPYVHLHSVLEAVCVSNNTKLVDKLDPSDKGTLKRAESNFIDPQENLTHLHATGTLLTRLGANND